jgi:hypothetical protein
MVQSNDGKLGHGEGMSVLGQAKIYKKLKKPTVHYLEAP